MQHHSTLKHLDQVNISSYLGIMFTSYGRCEQDVRRNDIARLTWFALTKYIPVSYNSDENDVDRNIIRIFKSMLETNI